MENFLAGFAYMSDHGAQCILHAQQVKHQVCRFIFAPWCGRGSKVTCGNGMQMPARFLQSAVYYPVEAEKQVTDYSDNEQHSQRDLSDRCKHAVAHVLHIYSGANHPTPWFESSNVRDLVYRRLSCDFRPLISDVSLATIFPCVGKCLEHGQSVRIFETAHVGAVELSTGGMHHHTRLLIVDPEVIVVVVA